MAIGLGLLFGFKLPENFNYPYISQSIKEFWRRWHISLSTWFRDYLYIPLGGNRGSEKRTYLNLFIVFFVTGLWHGASWNFIIWGLFHGTFIIVERLGFDKVLLRLNPVWRHFYTIFVFMTAWVLFRADNLGHALHYYSIMFNPFKGSDLSALSYLDSERILVIVIALIFCCPFRLKIEEAVIKMKNGGFFQSIYLFMLFLLSMMYLTNTTYNPFIYFRF